MLRVAETHQDSSTTVAIQIVNCNGGTAARKSELVFLPSKTLKKVRN
jgi:hypothetical protein